MSPEYLVVSIQPPPRADTKGSHMLNITQLPKARTYRVEFKVTWTGAFPVALMAKARAWALREGDVYGIEQSLQPYTTPRERTATLCFYTDDPVLVGAAVGMPDGEDFRLVRDLVTLVHPQMRTLDWYRAGCKIDKVRAEGGFHARKYAHVAVVKVCGDFPFDMLRYDDCTLLDHPDNIAKVLATFSPADRQPREVFVVKLTEGKKSPWPSIADGRWMSFRAFPECAAYDDVAGVTARV